MGSRITFRYWFEWYTPALWGERGGVLPQDLPLTAESAAEMERLSRWHDTSMNWFLPPAPGPWKQEECDRFNEASDSLYRRICNELGPDFDVINEQGPMREDPDLEEYVRDPDAYISSRFPWLKDVSRRPSAKANPFGTP